MPATSLPPGFMAHEYSRKQGRGRGTFSKILGAGPEVFQIKVTSEGFYAPKPLFFLKVVLRSSLGGKMAAVMWNLRNEQVKMW